jgi:hypothetical protein
MGIEKIIGAPKFTAYTPVHSAGWGTMDHATYGYVIDGDIMTIWGEQKNGSPSAVDLTIGLPVGYKVHAGIVVAIQVGTFQRAVVGTARYITIGTGGDIFLEIGRHDATPGPFLPMQGDDGMGTSEKQSLYAILPVQRV